MKTRCRDCCHPERTDPEACGCCEGIEIVTPLSTYNRPGLTALAYRIGRHASFMETMTARLSGTDSPALAGLTSRDARDASLALLDAWATVADVLTFYQERIANEGYLRTATERRSVLELANLVGYTLRPGVSASAFLAYTIDENTAAEVTIPRGSKAQSIPGPDELPQLFETSEAISARAAWNNLQPRLSQPQTRTSILNAPQSDGDPQAEEGDTVTTVQGPRLYLKGITTNLKPNDPLLIDFGDGKGAPEFSRVIAVYPDAEADRTLVTLTLGGVAGERLESSALTATLDDARLIKDLTQRPSTQRRNGLQLQRDLGEQFGKGANAGYGVAAAITPALRSTLAAAFGNATATARSNLKVYALRIKTPLFGHHLALPHCPDNLDTPDLSCCLPAGLDAGGVSSSILGTLGAAFMNPSALAIELDDNADPATLLALDTEYKELKQDTWAAVDLGTEVRVVRIARVASATLGGMLPGNLSFFSTCPAVTVTSNQGVSVGEAARIKTTIMQLDAPWRDADAANTLLRTATFHGHSEQLELAEEPIDAPVCGGTDDLIELDGFYEGLDSGRWVIVSGERELAGTSGVRFSELAMLGSVTQGVTHIDTDTGSDEPRSGETIHTFIKLAEPLAYCFRRATVVLHGNVAKATHGETRQETLGSGDGSKALQSFELKQKPLTFVSAANPSGVDSTLEVFVNGLRWHQVDTLADRQPADRTFIARTDDDDKVTLVFGNGEKGARLPSGVENVEAHYRSGIGRPGNVQAEQISLLQSKPLGVKAVTNPLRASGGANREGRDQARRNAPLAIQALDRLVSVRDYQDFSRTFAGVGKARAVELSDGRRQLVHVTIAGADDLPIDEHSDLFQNLRRALQDFGDPHQAIELAVRELLLLIVSARIRLLPDYQWEPVVSAVRTALLDAFSFERRALGQAVLLSEVISVMQAVPGVAYVDVDVLGGIPEKANRPPGDASQGFERRLLTPREIAETVQQVVGESAEHNRPQQVVRVNLAARTGGMIRPAQLAFLAPDAPETLILNRIE
ncbi:putative baseplate assembly protein [Marinobacter sp. X15-166B]|uniref:putative baseplate assembly protein n=1 Tax=Marinobacter sp. X15-166B TaxID=1897620 RepID=UPI00085BD413|nr:putative baseplate assembly protein [Marinobacter sp. X15-166B]OEY66763.1 putative baseplate assembly protein [Marinobacter sp. X15-166B]